MLEVEPRPGQDLASLLHASYVINGKYKSEYKCNSVISVIWRRLPALTRIKSHTSPTCLKRGGDSDCHCTGATDAQQF